MRIWGRRLPEPVIVAPDPEECTCRWVRDEDGLPECAAGDACFCACHDQEDDDFE